MAESRRRLYLLMIGLLAFLLTLCVIVAIGTLTPDYIYVDTERLDGLSLDLPTLLSSEWEIVSTYSEGNEDLEGRSSSIGEHIVVSAQHSNDPLVYIRQHIIGYDDVTNAENRFSRQVDWVFVRNFGVPVSRQINSYADIKLPLGSGLVAEDYKVACIRTSANVQCGGFFLQDRYIIYLEVVRIRNNIEYVTETEFFNLIESINDHIAISRE